MNDLSSFRKSYEKSTLSDLSKNESPFTIFSEWFNDAINDDLIVEPNAMTLSTVSRTNNPRNRVVLLKKFDENGFVFFSNYNSSKGEDIAFNPNVCLSFFWSSQERQIIVQGSAKKISSKESDDYFYSRPIESQVGAIVSNQSSVIPNREFLEEKFIELKKSTKIKRPDFWGGYLVNPLRFEFWQGRKNRLHDRIEFIFENSLWKNNRLSP
tara:strand:- start:5053 stop:5685 length:633 start_codon:yes stop_codon:yes gene_type:complete